MSQQAVLIAGAGPTGLSLAITLRRSGIPIRIVDRAVAPAAISKALACGAEASKRSKAWA
jgi:2-polyprenyl-6-methoxyphenol hydroxylase-like FAD-dependent oxidoreductase